MNKDEYNTVLTIVHSGPVLCEAQQSQCGGIYDRLHPEMFRITSKI